MRADYRSSATASFAFGRSVLPVAEIVATVARRVWPAKTARHLAARTSRTHRAAESWLIGQTGMSADALADLLRSDQGLAFLDAIMAQGPTPSWWPAVRNDIRAAGIERRLDDLRAEIDAAKRDVAR